MWQQSYAPLGGSLGLAALAAALPIFVLLYLLGTRRTAAWKAALARLSPQWWSRSSFTAFAYAARG